MDRLTIAMDFDGVLADTDAVKRTLLHDRGHTDVPGGSLNRSDALGALGPDLYERISLLATSAQATVSIAPVEGSPSAVRRLRRRGHRIRVLTRRRGARLSAARAWLARHPATAGIETHAVLRERKQDWCRRRRIDVLLDDDPAHLLGFDPTETKGLLLAPRSGRWRGWGIETVRDWPEAVAAIEARSIGAPPPFSATLELGRRCNLACRHCFSDSGPHAPPGPDTAQALARIDALADLGVRVLWLSGGEPTLRDDLPVLFERAGERALEVFVSTNGILDRRRAEQLRHRAVRRVDVALDGWRSDHDRLRGPGAFDRTIRGLGHLRAAPVPTGLSVHLRRSMVLGHAELAAHLAELGLPFRLAPLLPYGRGRALAHLCPTAEEIRAWHRTFETAGAEPLGDPADACWAGTATVAIASDGRVTPCCFQRRIALGSLGERPLSAVWRDAPVLRAVRRRPPAGCSRCTLKAESFATPSEGDS